MPFAELSLCSLLESRHGLTCDARSTSGWLHPVTAQAPCHRRRRSIPKFSLAEPCLNEPRSRRLIQTGIISDCIDVLDQLRIAANAKICNSLDLSRLRDVIVRVEKYCYWVRDISDTLAGSRGG